MPSKKSAAQLNAEIAEALVKHAPSRKRGAPSADVVATFANMADNAEAYGAENLFLARRAEGYMGNPKEFRFSEIFARRLPTYKYELLVDYIDEHRKIPHDRLGRAFTSKEADWMHSEAAKIRDEAQRALREAP